ncbi:MAG: hypothetical protein UU71_C0001G0032 [Parcubacteria group bacterium GW2011_GWB1_41_6]|nr:MAG: hypothetical protein UU71_C0001G0032 [Parcubacteria group bacterium GW2011_GWB1_41_6]
MKKQMFLGKTEEYSAELIESAPQKESGYLKVKNVFADNGN